MSGRMVKNIIEIRQGDSYAINVQVKDKKGCPVNLTGAVLFQQVKSGDGNIVLQVTGTEVDVLKGKMVLLFTPDMTAIPVGDYETDIQVTIADGNVNTIFPENVNQVGIFRITKQVTEG